MNDFHPFNYISLFAGGGGLDLGLELAVRNARCVAAVEVEAYARACLVARMEEGSLAPAPVYSDVRTFRGDRFRGLVDAVIGGSPCTDMSLAGKRAGLEGARSGLFFEMCRIVGECQPEWIYWENVGGAKKYLPAVFAEFEALGYAGKGTLLRASDVGAPHQRARYFVLARRVADAQRGVLDGWAGEPGRGSGGGVAADGAVAGVADADGRRQPGIGWGAGSSEASGDRSVEAGAFGPSEGPGLGLASTAGDGRHERGSEPTTARPAGVDDAGEIFFWIYCECGTEFVGRLDRPCPGCGEIRSGTTNELSGTTNELADVERAALRLEPRWSGGSDRTGTPVVGVAGEALADGDGLRHEVERSVGIFVAGPPRGDDVDGRGGEELADAVRWRSPEARTSDGVRGGQSDSDEGRSELADARDPRLQGGERSGAPGEGSGAPRPATERGRPEWPPGPDGDWSGIPARFFPAQPRLRGVADELAGGVELAVEAVWADRLRLLGNGVVPKQAAAAFRFLYAAITRSTIGADHGEVP